MPDQPLSGVKVLDVSPLLPGPFCAQILADLGAEVVRVEPPQGDYTRQSATGMYEVTNRNKRSLVLNLKDRVHRAAFEMVAASSDVLIEGFRPGVARRLGIDYPHMKKLNQALVYCSISGFGQDGPDRLTPGHDLVYLAASGALDFSGHWLEESRRAGVPASDLGSAAYAAISILAALLGRGPDGVGCHIDLAITDVSMAMTSVRAGPAFDVSGEDRLHLFPANDLFRTADDKVLAISAVEPHFWEGLRKVLSGSDPRIDDPRFREESGRFEHGDDLFSLMSEIIGRRDSLELIVELRSADVPVQEVLSAPDAAEAASRRGRKVIEEVDGQAQIPFPAWFDGSRVSRVDRLAPALGEHSREVLAEAGVSSREIDAILESTSQNP